MKNFSTKELTLTAVLTAIVLVMGLVPAFGFIPLTPMVGFTIIHIPVLVGAYFGGRKVGGFLGLVFGLTSLFVAFTRPSGLLDPIFTNPLVSVLPRFLFGFFAYDVLTFLKGKIKQGYLATAAYFGTMTLIHSVLVITFLYIAGVNFWYFDIYGISEELTREGTVFVIDYVADYFVGGASFFGFLLTIVTVNSLLEIAIAIVVGTPLATRLESALDFNKE